MPTMSEVLVFPLTAVPLPGELQQVLPGIFWTRIALPFPPGHVNSYIFDDGDGWVILDAGVDDEATRHAWRQLLAGPLACKSVKYLIVSHHHPDHIGLAGWLCRKLDVPLITSHVAYLLCNNIRLNPDSLNAESHRRFYRLHGMDESVSEVIGGQGREYRDMVSELPDMFERIVSDDVMRIGGRDFRVLMGDGHAPDQVMLYCESDRILLAADQVLPGITPNIGVYASESNGDPLGLFLRTLENLKAEMPADVLVCPGHELPFRGVRERCLQLQDHHAERCAAIVANCIRQPRSVADLVPILFDRPLDRYLMSFAFAETHAHVNYLVKRGELCRVLAVDKALMRFHAHQG